MAGAQIFHFEVSQTNQMSRTKVIFNFEVHILHSLFISLPEINNAVGSLG